MSRFEVPNKPKLPQYGYGVAIGVEIQPLHEASLRL
jgi:hypothetical protein